MIPTKIQCLGTPDDWIVVRFDPHKLAVVLTTSDSEENVVLELDLSQSYKLVLQLKAAMKELATFE